MVANKCVFLWYQILSIWIFQKEESKLPCMVWIIEHRGLSVFMSSHVTPRTFQNTLSYIFECPSTKKHSSIDIGSIHFPIFFFIILDCIWSCEGDSSSKTIIVFKSVIKVQYTCFLIDFENITSDISPRYLSIISPQTFL